MTDVDLGFAAIACRIDASVDVVFDPPTPVDQPAAHTQREHAFIIEPYIVDGGVPRDRPAVGVFAPFVAGVGTFDISDQVPSKLSVVTGASVRWLPTSNTFTESDTWRPFAGDGAMSWQAGPAASPYLYEGYTYSRASGSVESDAVIFDGASWMRLNTQGLSANAFSIGMVAVLQPGTGRYYSLFESYQGEAAGVTDDENAPVDVYRPDDLALHYSHGLLSLMVNDSPVVSYNSVSRGATPVVVVLSLATTGGTLAIYDGQRSVRTFSMAGVNAFDVDLFLGRGGLIYDQSTTAAMDVLELDFWDHALDETEMEGYMNLMATIHGIVP